jgi:cellulose synthase/poly-beta-1,6-N-acetylglucosamine synthase-like glycosyltransferase
MLELFFWILILFILYSYIGYPIVLWIWAKLRPKRINKKANTPFVNILICANNEEKTIRQRLENCLSLNYPKEKLEIIVATDGCTDRTNKIIQHYVPLGVKLVVYPERRGKAAVLNDTIPLCSGEIIVLADARQSFHEEAIKEFVANFYDPEVGGVSGELHLLKRDNGTRGKGIILYWWYEKIIRKMESQVDSTAGATGSLYAIRKCLFEPIPVDTLIEDVLIPLNIIRKGYRVIFEPKAKAYDKTFSTSHEFKRKVRTLTGNYQLLFHNTWMFSPLHNRIAIQLISHRLFQRILMPYILIIFFLINYNLEEGFYRIILVLQVLFYFLAFIGILFGNKSKWQIIALPYTLLLLNFASLVGFFKFFTKKQSVFWKSD